MLDFSLRFSCLLWWQPSKLGWAALTNYDSPFCPFLHRGSVEGSKGRKVGWENARTLLQLQSDVILDVPGYTFTWRIDDTLDVLESFILVLLDFFEVKAASVLPQRLQKSLGRRPLRADKVWMVLLPSNLVVVLEIRMFFIQPQYLLKSTSWVQCLFVAFIYHEGVGHGPRQFYLNYDSSKITLLPPTKIQCRETLYHLKPILLE